MKTIERGAIYRGDKTIGFRCDTCGRVFSNMLGDTCYKCQQEERRHKKILAELKRLGR